MESDMPDRKAYKYYLNEMCYVILIIYRRVKINFESA